ncbi:MAG: chromosome segregation protein SMC [Clostridiales bacterium GWE2_32_10]|nr:MAG: chromosome segregation protein SMC [Clostridiales bacterium GWE2_32_10]
MKLKKIEIKGFKSFADKLNLNIENGITCIVGPNGSGKSNIADAIRWVLGEQSAKSLRGTKMEEIIFSGTDARKPLGMAEVCMLLENSEGKLNTEFNEVEIKRKVYRSGEGEYFINDSSCRLKDIHDLFYDTGIGKEGYSIIGQGKIDEILNSKPAERRNFFEEATGISKYRIRLKDTEKKLDEEKQNLIRVNDIISELTNQIEPLCEQSKKATEYLDIKEKLKEDEINIYIHDAKKAKEQLASVEENKVRLEKEIADANNNSVNIKKAKVETFEEYTKLKTEVENRKDRLSHLEIGIEKKDSETKILDEKINNAKYSKEESNERKTSLLDLTNSKQKLLESLKSEYESLMVNIAKEEELLYKKQEHYELIDSATKDKNIDLEKAKNDIENKTNEVYELKAEVEKLDLILDSLREKQTILENEIKDASNAATQIDSQLELNKKQIEVYFAQKEKVKDKILELTNKQTDHEQKTQLLQNKEHEMIKDINNMKSKYNIYLDMKNHHEGYGKSIKTILGLKINDEKKWTGICGVFGELINVKENYEVAIDVALGARIQNMVVDDEATAKQVISFLKDNKQGRATFLPISSIKSNENQTVAKNVLAEVGVLGVASDFVTSEDKYSNIISSMLGKTIIIDTIENAINFSKKYKYGYKVVTIDGEIFNIGGSITGGSISNKTANVFTRTREIDELKVKIAQAESKAILLHEEIKTANTDKHSNETDILIKNKELQNLEYELIKIKNNYDIIEKNKLNSLEKSSRSTSEKHSIQKQIIEISEEIMRKDEKKKETQKDIESKKAKIEEYKLSLDTENISKYNINEEITGIKVELAAFIQKSTMQKEEIDRIYDEINNVNEELKLIYAKIVNLDENIEKNIQAKINLINEIEVEKEIIFELVSKIAENEKTYITYEENIKQIEEKLEVINNQISTAQDKIYKLENSSIEYRLKNENIEEDLFEKYKLTYDEAKAYENENFSYMREREHIKNYRSQIEKLGNVNLDAIEQYKTIKERYDFLVYQRDDIQKAEQKLEEIIKELLTAMQKQFEYEFKEIDKNFDVIFKEMFGGGRAKLKLIDEQNTLESGIDIVVQPPGKNLQNIMLLSGGEKALTAISLLFAILKLRPSPFCVLDEIEAALDDANVGRYANYIKNYSTDTQFLVITHRKGTMEISDYLYGVTMEEKGISKVISVKLEEAVDSVVG